MLWVVLLVPACDQDGNFNVFSIQDDIALGQQVSAEIESNRQQYPILPETGRNGRNEQAYRYLRGITAKILNSGNVTYREEFPWQVKIIQDDKTLNAFCTPGGYIYVYTDLIKYLDTEDQLAGVMGHEIAHADKRHTTDNLTKAYGWQLLIDIVVGSNQGAVTEIAKSNLDKKATKLGISKSELIERFARDMLTPPEDENKTKVEAIQELIQKWLNICSPERRSLARWQHLWSFLQELMEVMQP